MVEITCSVKVGGERPSFSYHAILSSKADAERTSTSPSPSTSVAKTDWATSAVVEITRSVKGISPPRAGSATARLAAIPASGPNTASGFNTAAKDAAVTLPCFTISRPSYVACRRAVLGTDAPTATNVMMRCRMSVLSA